MNARIGTALVVLGGLAVVAGGLGYWKYAELSAPPAPGFEPAEAVQVVTAQKVNWRPTADLVGTVFALRSVTVSNEVAGTVTKVGFDSGELVEAGRILITLDAATEEAELKAAEASIRVAESNTKMVESDIRLAESNLRRMKQAQEAKAAPQMDVDQAEANLASSTANLQRMAAEIDQARARAEQIRSVIAKKTLRAPFKARASIRTVQPGQYLKEGSEIVALQSIDDTIYLDFALPQDQLIRVKPGDSVMANSAVLGAEPVRIEVVAIDSSANSETRNVRLRSIVANPGERLRPGMFVDVQVPVGDEQSYVSIPSTAVRRAPYGDHVFIVGPGEKNPQELRVKQRFVKLGPSLGNSVIVIDGLKEGDRIAAAGSFKLREDALVMEGTAPGAAPGSAPGHAPDAHAGGTAEPKADKPVISEK